MRPFGAERPERRRARRGGQRDRVAAPAHGAGRRRRRSPARQPTPRRSAAERGRQPTAGSAPRQTATTSPVSPPSMRSRSSSSPGPRTRVASATRELGARRRAWPAVGAPRRGADERHGQDDDVGAPGEDRQQRRTRRPCATARSVGVRRRPARRRRPRRAHRPVGRTVGGVGVDVEHIGDDRAAVDVAQPQLGLAR